MGLLLCRQTPSGPKTKLSKIEVNLLEPCGDARGTEKAFLFLAMCRGWKWGEGGEPGGTMSISRGIC